MQIVEQNSPTRAFKLLTFMAMLYVTVILIASAIIFRMIELVHIEMSAGVFLIALWFILADIITEVYGYTNCKKIIWQTLFCSLIFGSICSLINYLPTPKNWHYSSYFSYVFAKQIQVSLVLCVAVVLGGFINAYLLSKWKIAWNGKFFWIRCIVSSGISQLIFSVVTITFNFYNQLSTWKIFVYICIGYPEKMIVLSILTIPATICIYFLKKIEGIDYFEQKLKFNPFSG